MKNIDFTFSDYKREFEGNFNTKINGIKNILSIMDIKEVSNKTLEKRWQRIYWDYFITQKRTKNIFFYNNSIR